MVLLLVRRRAVTQLWRAGLIELSRRSVLCGSCRVIILDLVGRACFASLNRSSCFHIYKNKNFTTTLEDTTTYPFKAL